MKKLIMFGALVFALNGCSIFGGESAEDAAARDAAAARSAITAAEDALKKARSVDGEWRDSRKKILKKAKAAASKGDFKKAVELANEAKFQADAGYAQAMEQKDAGPWLF
ncbi:MAG: SoxXA-binding protein [Gammaproteobacteria bacterium]|nr:SoxXA-binding protein [Gammaproteobacteria bacterium]